MKRTYKKLHEINMKEIVPLIIQDEKLKVFKVNYKKKITPYLAQLINAKDESVLDTSTHINKYELLQELSPFIAKFMKTHITISYKDNINPKQPNIEFMTKI